MSIGIGLIAGGMGFLAADTIAAGDDGNARTDSTKIFRVHDGYIAYSGDIPSGQRLVTLLKKYQSPELIPSDEKPKSFNAEALWLSPGPKLTMIQCDFSTLPILRPAFFAIGCGDSYALGALSAIVGMRGEGLKIMSPDIATKTIREVMKIVFTWNKHCGGRIKIKTVG